MSNIFDDAIKTHVEWKTKLSVYIKNQGGNIDLENIKNSDNCALGKWISGEGKEKFSHIPEFQELMKCHDEFHKCAANLVKKIGDGEKLSNEMVLGSNSEYDLASKKVINLLMKMQLIKQAA